VDQTLIHGLVDQGHGRVQKLNAAGLIVMREGPAKLFDRSTQFAAVAAVDLFAFCVLSYTLFR
jgi:hypothetical protein